MFRERKGKKATELIQNQIYDIVGKIIYHHKFNKSNIFLLTSCQPKEGKTALFRLFFKELSSTFKTGGVTERRIPIESQTFQVLDLPLVKKAEGTSHKDRSTNAGVDTGTVLITGSYRDIAPHDFFSLQEAVRQLEIGHDLVLIDGPSLDQRVCSELLTQVSHKVILVLDMSKTSRRMLIQYIEKLKKADTELMGIILNKYRSPLPGFIRKGLGLYD